MSRREVLLWGGALLISLLAHAALFFSRELPLASEERIVNAERTTTRVTFRAQAALPAAAQPVVQASPPEPEPVIAEKPKPPAREKPRPVARKVIKPKPPQPREAEKPPTVEAVATPVETPTETAPVAVVQSQVGVVAEIALSPQAREHYLKKLLAHIEAHKHYPRAARRRRQEGEMVVSFLLLSGGRVNGLRISEGPSLLRDAAQAAVRDSTPLPAPPAGMPLPLPVEFKMVFTLQ